MKDSDSTLYIAHRGDSDLAPENTIEACQFALDQGAEGLEVDVRLCGTGEVILYHDRLLYNHFKKLKPVFTTSLADIKKLDFPQNNYKVQAKISTLAEFLETFKGKVPLNLDAKTFWDDQHLAENIIDEIERHEMQDQVWVSSFNPTFLKIMKIKRPKIRTGYLFSYLPAVHRTIDRFINCDAWHPHFSMVTDKLIQSAKKFKKEMYIWTVNEKEVLDKMLSFGFEGIITDTLFRKHNSAK